MIREPLVLVCTCEIAGRVRGKGFPARELPERLVKGVGWVPTNTMISAFGPIGDTPFGVDFAPPTWPGMWANRAMVANHGAAGSWVGARIVGIAMDPNTGLPVPSSNTSGQNTGGMADFANGWDDGTRSHGRPAAVEFSHDGRMFVGNDTNGVIFWIAPIGAP